jgi:transposase InsO family protein
VGCDRWGIRNLIDFTYLWTAEDWLHDALLHHSEQGSQYTSDRFKRLFGELGIT